MRETLRVFDRLALVGLATGVLAGLWEGRGFLDSRFDLAVLQPILRGALGGLVFAAVFSVLFALVSFLGKRSPDRWLASAVLVAALPLVAAGGYLLNRAVGIRPSELLSTWALTRNLAYLAVCAVGVLLLVLILRRGRFLPPGAGLGASLLLTLGLWITGERVFRPSPEVSGPPDVVVLLVDALRADRLSAAGYRRATTPRIDELAGDGVLFRQAIASSTFTKTSIASLLTGQHPYRHGVYWGSRRGPEGPGAVTSDLLPEEAVTLAELLRAAGYLTGAWIQNSHLRDFMGFGQGFVAFHDQQGAAPRINRGFFRFLDGPGRRWPYFAYLHYIDLHDPYLPEPPWLGAFDGSTDVYEGLDLGEWGRHLRAVREGEITVTADELETIEALYDEQVRFLDDQVGRVLDRLRRDGRYEDSLVVLTSDHGDAFLEHGALGHSTTPYEELVRVPLVVKLPGNRHAGNVVDDPVRLVDVLPTVLDVLDRRIPRRVDGCSLLPLISRTEALPRDPACSSAVIEIAEDPERYPTVAIRTDRWKYIHHEAAPDELYDLLGDPRERTDLLGTDREPPEIASDLRHRALAVVASRPDPRDRIELDAATIEEMKALGYL